MRRLDPRNMGGGRFRRAKWFIPVLVIVLAVVAVLGVRAATGAGWPWSSAPAEAAHELAYQATSTGSHVVVTYTRGDSGVPGQGVGSSPWSAVVPVSGNVAFLTVAGGDSAEDGVSCSIADKATGQVLAHNSVTPGSGGTVTCVIDNLGSARKQ